jgi:Amidohydrolase family
MQRQRFPPVEMRSLLLLGRVLGAVCAAASASVVRAQAPRDAPVIALTRVTLVDPARDAPQPDATIVIQGQRIVAAGPRRAVAIPRGARVIDASGKYVIPGLWDMHTHVAQPVAPGVELETGAAYFFPLFIAYGVTGVRDMAGDLTTLRRWRGEIEQGARLGPRLIITGEKLGKGPVVPGAPFPIEDASDVQRSVQGLKDSGAAFVKLHVIRRDLIGQLMRSASALGMPVAGHVEIDYSVRDLALARLHSVEHLDGVLLAANRDEAKLRVALQRNARLSLWHRLLVKVGLRQAIAFPDVAMLAGYSAARADSLFDLFRRTDTWHCPTLRLLGALYHQTDPSLRLAADSLLLREVRDSWNGFISAPFEATHPRAGVYPKLQEAVQAMARRGVGILAGTDTPGLSAVPGRSLHEELGLLVSAGLTPREALRAATTGPAQYLGARDSLGTIRAGAVADLVLLDSDPLVDITNTRRIRAVFARGQYFDRVALSKLISDASAVARRVRSGAP